MSIEIKPAARSVTLKGMLNRWKSDDECSEFFLLPEEGEPIRFHWLEEVRSDVRDECEQMLERLCKQFGIPLEYEEV